MVMGAFLCFSSSIALVRHSVTEVPEPHLRRVCMEVCMERAA